MNAYDFVGGHSILALERFRDETRHMIIFDVLSWKSPVGEKGERLRPPTLLTDIPEQRGKPASSLLPADREQQTL